MENVQEYNKSIFEYSQEEYQNLFDSFEEKMLFKGYSIKEWLLILDIKDINPGFSLEDLEKFNLKIINQTDLVYTNQSLASSNYLGLKRSVERSMMKAKQDILQEIDEHNKSSLSPADKKKYPTADNLESQAYNRCSDLQLSLSISEIWNTFWETQAKKIYSLNQRMTSLSVGKNIEMKTSQ